MRDFIEIAIGLFLIILSAGLAIAVCIKFFLWLFGGDFGNLR
jgi:hypothetical protein